MKRVRMVVEWAKGCSLRDAWLVGKFLPPKEDRPAPVNYGLIPGLLNPADGEEVDAVLLGPPLPLGEAEGYVVGLLHLKDGDHKLLLAPTPTPPSLEALKPLLAWFAPERKPKVLGPEAAWAWLRGLGYLEDEHGVP